MNAPSRLRVNSRSAKQIQATLGIHPRMLEKSTILSSYQMAKVISPREVAGVVNKAKIRLVLAGAYGVAGWRKEARATEDVDVIVASQQVKKAVAALLAAFPELEAVELPLVVRLRERGSSDVAINVMKPLQQPYREVFDHTSTVKSGKWTYHVPSLEMAIATKFSAMVSLYRAADDKYQDAHDFILMVKQNADLDEKALSQLADLIYPDGGRDVLELVRQARAGEMLKL